MGRAFEEFPTEFDAHIRSQVARQSDLSDTTITARWLLRGSKLSFYPRAWLAYLERVTPDGSSRADRYYFVVQSRARRKNLRLVPMANEAGSVDRANRECRLAFPTKLIDLESVVIDYLNFYYAFTPQYDPLLANLDEGPTHFGVPLTIEDLRFEGSGAASDSLQSDACSDPCLARGAVWHYLDSATNKRFVAIRLRMRRPYPRITGRMVIQFRRGLFATDFRIPASSNTPTLGNPELLYESTALRAPAVYPQTSLRVQGFLGFKDLWRALKTTVALVLTLIGTASIALVAWTMTILFSVIWFVSGAYPFMEMTGWQGGRDILHFVGAVFGFQNWAHTLRYLSCVAIAAFLASIIYITHMDKIFNFLFWLCPRGRRMWLAEKLANRVSRRDRELIAQDTFRKRALWALRRLSTWSAYIVLAFASVQISLNGIYGLQMASASRIVLTLLEQAAINIPLILYVLVRVPGLIGNLDPVADGVLSAQLLFWFHAAMVLIVIKGVYRVWTFTVDASPHAFYRRLPVTNRLSSGDIDVV
jgi:hypothetical protein